MLDAADVVLSHADVAILREIQAAADDEIVWDSGRIFNTLSCRPHPLALEAFRAFADRNLLKEQTEQGRRLEAEVVATYASWFGAEDQAGKNGYVCSGGTEGNFMALWMAKARWPSKRKVVLSQYAHYSYDRFAAPLGLDLLSVPVRSDLEGDSDAFVRAIDEDTLVAVVTGGDPVLGRHDALAAIVAAAQNVGCGVHVDGAYGGYLMPAVKAYRDAYRTLLASGGGVMSLTLDPHKYGLCPLGTGLVLVADRSDLDRISLSVKFPPIEARSFQGSRAAGPAAAVWAMTRKFGWNGYLDLARDVMAKRVLLEDGIRAVEQLECVVPPRLTSVGFRFHEDEARTLDLYHRLVARGYRITPHTRPSFFLRAIVHHHTERWHIERLCNDVRQCASEAMGDSRRGARCAG